MKQTIGSFALIVLAALSLQAFAHDKHDKKANDKGKATAAKVVKVEFLGKGDGLKTCPVTGEEIHSKDVKGRFFNRTVYFCCAGCLDEAKKSPAAYVKRTQAAQIAATKNLPKVEGHHADHQDQTPKEGEKQDSKGAEKKFLGRGDESEKQDSKGAEKKFLGRGDEGEKQDSKGAEKKFLGKGDGIETCPVMGDPVSKNFKYEVNGRVFYVCCPGCAEVVKKDPDLYLKPVEVEKKKEQEFLGKGDGLQTCPVTGEAVDKETKYEVDGQTFYVCCPGCADTVKKSPAAYLKKAAK